MNKYLLLNFVGPEQSYCIDPKTSTSFKKTLFFPTKSAVAGMICNAIGYERDEIMGDNILKEIANLKMHVRIDRSGIIIDDYQCSGGGKLLGKKNGVYRASGGIKHQSNICIKQYINDSKFLVALFGKENILKVFYDHLREPKRALVLGRKRCVPSESIILKNCLVNGNEGIKSVFKKYLNDRITGKEKVRVVLETDEKNEMNLIVQDVLIFMNKSKKIMRPRFVKFDDIIMDNN